MQAVLSLIPLFLTGIGFYALFYVWKKSAAKWNSWFPLLKRALELTLLGTALAMAGYAAYAIADNPGPAWTALASVAGGVLLPGLGLRRSTGGVGTVKEETKRGATIGEAVDVSKLVQATKLPTHLKIGGIPVPVSAEPYHFLISGATGTGKSVAIGSILDAIRERGDTAIVVDSGGNFASTHFQSRTDFVFNPYDDRCVAWSPTGEMQGAWDAQALARSIVPDGSGESREWNSYAQTFVGAVLRKLWETNRLTLKDFLYYVQVASRAELQELIGDTAAASQLAAERTFGSIRTIAGNYVSSYDYLPEDKESFSVSKMIQAEHSGVLFLTYRDDQLDSLRNIMACLIDVAARTILSLEPSNNRRVWLILDEFASLGKIQSIEALATKSRKAGGCLVIGLQSVSQLKDRYGENGAQTILSCLSTWLVLRCSDADTAEYMSKYIGDAEVSRQQKGVSDSDSGATSSWSEQSSTQRVVLGSQIQAFKNLHGLLKLAGDYPVCSVDLPIPKERGVQGKSFLARDFRLRPMLKLVQAAGAPVEIKQEKDPVLLPSTLPGYSDKTPRPARPAKNLLVVAAKGKANLKHRLEVVRVKTERTRAILESMAQNQERTRLKVLGKLSEWKSTKAVAPEVGDKNTSKNRKKKRQAALPSDLDGLLR